MNATSRAGRSFLCAPVSIRRFARSLLVLAALVSAFVTPPARAAETGTITGSVSNVATGNLLAGAKVELPALGLSVLTDDSGAFILTSVPAGTHELVATYL